MIEKKLDNVSSESHEERLTLFSHSKVLQRESPLSAWYRYRLLLGWEVMLVEVV